MSSVLFGGRGLWTLPGLSGSRPGRHPSRRLRFASYLPRRAARQRSIPSRRSGQSKQALNKPTDRLSRRAGNTSRIFRVFVMSSSGLASSTIEAADLARGHGWPASSELQETPRSSSSRTRLTSLVDIPVATMSLHLEVRAPGRVCRRCPWRSSHPPDSRARDSALWIAKKRPPLARLVDGRGLQWLELRPAATLSKANSSPSPTHRGPAGFGMITKPAVRF